MGMPEGWRVAPLGVVAVPGGLQTGPFGSQLKASEYSAHGVPVVMPKDMSGGRVHEDSIARVPEHVAESRLGLHRVQPGDVLFARRGEIGRCALVTVREAGWVCGTGCLRARPSDAIDSRFLVHQLLAEEATRWLNERAVGQTMLNLNTQILAQLPLAIPPLPEQRKIAAILSSVDEAIEKTETVIEQLQVVKKAMMQELLTRGMPGRHTRFKQTEIGEIPEGWEVVSIGTVCERMFVGIAQAATHAYVARDGVPIVRTTNVKPNRIERGSILLISHEFARSMASKSLRAGDVLTARTGYPGVSALVDSDLDGAQCFTLLVARPGPRLAGKFLVHVMNSPIGELIVQQGQAGGAQQNLNVSTFEASQIALPPREEQDEIAAAIGVLYERERAEEATLSALRIAKQQIAASLLSGDLRVTPDEATP